LASSTHFENFQLVGPLHFGWPTLVFTIKILLRRN
jgi:hypothetical protein